ARGTVESFDAVARADLRVVQGGVLQVNVTERLPAVVWRTRDGLWLLDAEGHRIAVITARGLRADLPLVAGKGASDATPEALALFKVAEPLSGRVRGLVRVGERRWDLVLDRDQRILLPEMQPERALERVIALDQAQGLLARDLLAVDLRNERRPTVRVNPEALDHLRPAWTTVTPATAMTMTETRP
ncbi:MAG: cell division protein FtsQ/DivIB, partial [Gemmobacter sp.]